MSKNSKGPYRLIAIRISPRSSPIRIMKKMASKRPKLSSSIEIGKP